eukprot:1159235-Pelagomonas_calceolata.AAC.13
MPRWYREEKKLCRQRKRSPHHLRKSLPRAKVVVLLLGSLELILGPGVFTVFDLHKTDVPLSWKEHSPESGLLMQTLFLAFPLYLHAIIQHSPDADAKEIGKDLFKALARSEESRNAMAEAMRSTVNASK